jgi:hypothetical protein
MWDATKDDAALIALEILMFAASALLGLLWVLDPDGPFEPWTYLCGIVGIGIELYRRYRSPRIAKLFACLVVAFISLGVWLFWYMDTRNEIKTFQPTPSMPISDIEGTTWKFSGANTTVEFLKGGNVRFSNSASGGHWQQWGNFIRFDADNFTTYEVSVSGDRMTGRLQSADDQGKFQTTVLTRIR